MTPGLMKKIAEMAVKPKLVIIQIGSLKESDSYIEKKKTFGQRIGAEVFYKQYPESARQEEIIADISSYNSDPGVHGIIVQLPIPKPFDTSRIIEAIDPKKDVDGLTAANTKLLFDNEKGFIPATTQGILTLLAHNKITIAGKKVVMVGESILVGRPTALAFLNRKATVTLCHSHTTNLEEETRRADILIIAVGEAELIKAKHVSENQVVIDVGINITPLNKALGDVDFKEVEPIVSAITPVPGGVGPMTVFSLFENLLKALIYFS